MRAGIIVIGKGILEGKVSDSNSPYIAKRISEIGIAPGRVAILPDEKEVIEEEVKSQLAIFPIVFTAGGLGATPDDLTREALSAIFKKTLFLDEMTLKKVERFYKEKGLSVPESATKQALYLQGALLLENPVGISPGMIIRDGERTLIALPGVPEELQKIFETGVLPFLLTTFPTKPLFAVWIRTTGITEAEIMERLAHPKRKFKSCTLEYFPSLAGVDIRITTDKDEGLLSEWKEEIITRLSPYVYALGNIPLEEKVGELLRKRELKLVVAESCTGGLLGHRITNSPGSSDYFLGGVIAYANEIKKSALGVKEETLKRYGAVSREVALEMAKGVRERFGAGIGLGVTGIAGPTGGSAKKPVGLVYIGLATINRTICKEFHFSGNRRMIKEQAAQSALDLLRRYLEGYD
jgi:nicotinamide-nucleotide amidase